MSSAPTIKKPTPPAGRPRRVASLLWPFVATLALFGLGFLSHARTNARLAWTFGGVAAGLALWEGLLWLRGRGKKAPYQIEIVIAPSHYVQALMQGCVYAYWGWHWRNVFHEAPLILAQVVFLYIIDGLISWSRGQVWRVGFGPWPIILSTNLFLWFRDDWFALQFVMVALGALGKQFIRWKRNGRLTHIFNPSAFGLAVVSLALILTQTSGYTWGENIATTLGRPHYIYVEIFLVGLVVQYFFEVTMVTLSATVALVVLNLIYTKATGSYQFVDSNIPIAVFLGLHLLVTDPVTSPRSLLGKALFGALYGAGCFGAFSLLTAFGAPTFYDKLVVVPFLNLLAPALDKVASLGVFAAAGRWAASIPFRRINLATMACWAAVFAALMGTGFIEAPHPGETVAFWKKAAAEGRPRATQNLLVMLEDRASEGSGEACNELGVIYLEGKLMPTNAVVAAHYFAQSCERGIHAGCANLVIQCYFFNQAVPPESLDAALTSLEADALTTTNGRDPFLVACAYDTGKGRTVDKIKARQFYAKAEELGNIAASKNLARMELIGEGGVVDHAGAAASLQKAADGGDGQSCLILARMYHEGNGVKRDDQHSIVLLQQACKLGVHQACQMLEQMRKK